MNRDIKIALVILITLVTISAAIWIRSQSKQNPEPGIAVESPYTFKSRKAEQLSIKAFDLKSDQKYNKAIQLYQQAITIEADNPKLYFDLADCFFRINKLEEAIQQLDVAIILDSSYAPSFGNRGLYYYRLYDDKNALRNYLKSKQLDSTNFAIYANLALVYYDMNRFKEACETLDKSKHFGLTPDKLHDEYKLKKIESYCELEKLLPEKIDTNSQ